MSRTYPYKAWVIQQSGKLKEIELARDAGVFVPSNWDETDPGKVYHVADLHPTKGAAIAAGLAALDAQQAKLTKQQTTLDKKRATLIAAREKA